MTDWKKLYQKIEERDLDAINVVLTVVEGEHTGEKAFFSDGKIQWSTEKVGLLERIWKEAGAGSSAGLIIWEGQKIFVERIASSSNLVICGGGHVSVALVGLAKTLGFPVTVLEDRSSFADAARRAGADRVICDDFASGLAGLEGSADTYFVIVTRGHRYDTLCLKAVLGKSYAYAGMMGSRRRAALVLQSLEESGVDRKILDEVHTPIGLAIGAETPEEIAVSVMAEIIQVKSQNKKSAGYTEELLEYLTGKEGEDLKKVLVTIVSRKGSAPRATGTKMLVLEDGRTVGTIGGGCTESEVITQSILMMRKQETNPKLMELDMSGREAEEEGMVCGGRIEVYLEHN